MSNKIFKPEKISILNHPEINEAVIQQIIAENPSILSLGELILKDKERIQPTKGRLDLLLQDPNTQRRYEVEIQLGAVDESHIIRTVEYWDTERKRYPQYDHCAVIIAEDITTRFLNVISLFNSNIPIIAIQMNAYKFEDKIGLVFTTILDELTLGLVDEDEETKEITDRKYWVSVRGTEHTVSMADKLLDIINSFSGGFELKYNKFYIGLAKDGKSNIFAIFRPQRNALVLEIRLPFSEDIQKIISDNDLDDMGYDKKWKRFRLRINGDCLKDKVDVITKLLEMSYKESL